MNRECDKIRVWLLLALSRVRNVVSTAVGIFNVFAIEDSKTGEGRDGAVSGATSFGDGAAAKRITTLGFTAGWDTSTLVSIFRLPLILIVLFLVASPVQAKERLFGFCEDGNQNTVTAGITSTTLMQRSYPPCRVTVYLAGTVTLATLCSDNLHPTCTPLGNPFTSTTTGYWFFYPFNGRYDVRFDSVGIAGCPNGPQCIATAFTHGDWLACDPADSSDPNPCGAGGGGGGGGGGGLPGPLIRHLFNWYAGCNNATPATSWDLPAASAMVPACKTDGVNNTVQGVLQAATSTVAYFTEHLPADWLSFASARIQVTTSDTTLAHTIIFQLATACVAPDAGNTDTPAYNAAQSFSTITIAGGAVANALYSANISSVTGTGCAAGNTLHLKLTRFTDTSTDTAVTLTGALLLDYNASTPIVGTGSVGGAALGPNSCTDTSIALTGVTTAMRTVANPAGTPGANWGNFQWSSYPTAGNVVVRICNVGLANLTPAVQTFNLSAFN